MYELMTSDTLSFFLRVNVQTTRGSGNGPAASFPGANAASASEAGRVDAPDGGCMD